MSKIETNKIDSISGTSTLKIGETNATTLDFDTGITSVTNIPTDLTNTPAYHAYGSAATSIPNNTATLLPFNTELLDTDNAYDTSTYFFTPQVAGKYFVFGQFRLNTSTDLDNVECIVRKNGSNLTPPRFGSIFNGSNNTAQVSTIVDLNGSSDYIGIYAAQYSGSAKSLVTNGQYAFAYRLIGV